MVSSSRPRTPSAGTPPPPPNTNLPPIPEGANRPGPAPTRRSSLGILLRRSKSGDLGSKGRKQAALREQELERQRREAIPRSPPKLPVLYNGAAPPQLQSFGGEGGRPDSVAIVSNRVGNFQQPGKTSMDQRRGMAGVPIPPIPNQNGSRNGAGGSDWVDPYARTESMTHRGRYSYASSAVSTINSPRRVRRRKDPTPFNILIIGARSSGKTSFLNFLKSSLALPPKKSRNRPTELADDIFNPGVKQLGTFESHYVETEIDGERIGLTLWDSEGLEKNVVDLQLREMSSFLESKFEETFAEEMKVVRAPGVQDTHIHCAFLILDPSRLDQNLAAAKLSAPLVNGGVNGSYNGEVKPPTKSRSAGGLDEDLDLQVLRTLQGKTTVVPVISKADTITVAHMAYLKKQVSDSLRKANLDPLEALGLEDFDDSSSSRDSPSRIEERDEPEIDAENGSDSDVLPIQANTQSPSQSPSQRLSSSNNSIIRHRRNHSSSSILGADPTSTEAYLPLSIISPDMYDPGVIGRKFPWGFADPMNEEHCDFVKLKDSVFTEWRGELREASRELWYEGWRTSRLKLRGVTPGGAR